MSADCINTQSMLGRNLTPVPIVEAAREVMGNITNDYCSDEVANKSVQAVIYEDFALDGYARLAKLPFHLSMGGRNVFLNPPGESWTGGTIEERELLQKLLFSVDEAEQFLKDSSSPFEKDLNSINLAAGKAQLEQFLKEHKKDIKRINAADWYRALYRAWLDGYITRAIWVLYRGGSFGSLGKAMLQDSVLCLTAAGAESDCINGSGRLAFETVDENDQRVPQTSNTQSSIIGYLPARTNLEEERAKFCKVFSQFGACGGFWQC